jgi:large subunit ribosomal protein L33
MPYWSPGACGWINRDCLCLDLAGAICILPARTGRSLRHCRQDPAMAKAANIKIKLLSSADTGYFYVTSKNARTKTEKLSFKKYDPVAKKHVEFKETKIK